MQYLKSYLNRITERGNAGLAESISATAEEVGGKYLKNFSFTSHEIGLLFGNVQSGKTGQMFGIICKATDLGFPVFVLLTTDNVVLQQPRKIGFGGILHLRRKRCRHIHRKQLDSPNNCGSEKECAYTKTMGKYL